MQKQAFSDIELLELLRRGGEARERAWQWMYENWRHFFRGRVERVGGTAAEADGALGRICVPFERRVTSPDFVLTDSPLSAYLTKCVFNEWLAEKKRTSAHPATLELGKVAAAELPVELPHPDPELARLLDLAIEKAVGERCRSVLKWFAEKYSMAEIGQQLDITPEAAKNLKYQCQQNLRAWFSAHPETGRFLKNHTDD